MVAEKDKTVAFGISLPKSLWQEIDDRRGDIPRSTFLRRIIKEKLGVT